MQSQVTEAEAEVLNKLYQNTRVPDPAKVQTVDKGKFKADAVGHADVTDLLLEHDLTWNWRPMTPEETPTGGPALERDKNGDPCGLWIYLTVAGLARPGYGSVESSAREPVKELIGDAIRNAAMRFGVALTLWSKTERAQQTSTGQPTTPTAQAEDRNGAAGPGTERPAAPSGDEPKWQKTLALVKQTKTTDEELAKFRAWLEKKGIPNDFAKMSDTQLNDVLAEISPL